MQNQEFAAVKSYGQASALSALGGGQISEPEKVRAFWRRIERYGPGAQISREDRPGTDRQLIIVSGWACELRILQDGRRQIFAFLLPGDTIEARATTNLGERGVVALTRLEVVDPGPHLAADSAGQEAVLRALHEAALRQEQRIYDQMLRMGRLSAKERVGHLLLELFERLDSVGLVRGDTFKIPLTQEVFADALGLSIVHINRTLKELRKEGSVTIKGGLVTLPNRERLAAASCYASLNDGWPSAKAAPPAVDDGRSRSYAGLAGAPLASAA
jgi:CRP-like cAMP-binding protein